MKTKHIFVTGGVMSGLGKGITAASLGRLLKNRGYKVINQKMDPYINVDSGTMSPIEHGETYVTEDGFETDLDLGHYERFVDENLDKNCSITTGRIYSNVIKKERNGEYLGKTVQVIPHVTDEMKRLISSFDDRDDVDIVITEIGGTIGDIEGLSFIEAIRQFGAEREKEDVIYIHVTLIPTVMGGSELKSKPTQHAVKELQSMGITPDILVCRVEREIPESIKEKLALYCNIRKECIISNLTVKNLYELPLMLEEEGLALQTCKHLKLENLEPHNEEWERMIKNINEKVEKTVNIAIVGKYISLEDSYLSIVESLKHAGFKEKAKVNITYINSECITKDNVKNMLSQYDGILVPGGFGERGIEGKIEAAKFARENNVPYFGICLGMQMAVIEFARNVLGYSEANSEEFDAKTKYPVIHIMEAQKDITQKGGTMRLGAYPCKLDTNSKVYDLYKNENITERHRHRYEYNSEYRKEFENLGLKCVGTSPDNELVEIIELDNHPFYVGCQFHPEFKSRPNRPHPLFDGFIRATML